MGFDGCRGPFFLRHPPRCSEVIVDRASAAGVAVSDATGHPPYMETEPDGFEESARIVEAFAAGRPDHVVELLTVVARAIRDHATDD